MSAKNSGDLKVKIFTPNISSLEHVNGCGILLFELPILLYIIIKGLVLKRTDKLVERRVQVVRKTGLFSRQVLLEEDFQSIEKAQRRYEELLKQVQEGTFNNVE